MKAPSKVKQGSGVVYGICMQDCRRNGYELIERCPVTLRGTRLSAQTRTGDMNCTYVPEAMPSATLTDMLL